MFGKACPGFIQYLGEKDVKKEKMKVSLFELEKQAGPPCSLNAIANMNTEGGGNLPGRGNEL